MIGLGVLAVAGIGLYMWKRRKDGESSSSDGTKSNAVGRMTSLKSNLGNVSTSPTPTQSIVYVHKCTTTNKDGTINATTSYTNTSASPCPSGAKHEILKVIAN